MYDNILVPEEKELIRTILALEADAQRLFFRLVLRKADWFRMSKLKYADIKDTTSSASILTEAGLSIGNLNVYDIMMSL